MKKNEIQKLINKKIPITKSLKFKIIEFSDEKISIHADLKTNSNIHNTAFAGSISTILILTAWLRGYYIMQEIDPDAYLVLEKSSTEYKKPIITDLVSCSLKISNYKKNLLYNKYKTDGKYRIKIESFIEKNNDIYAKFNGIFYVRRKK